MATLLAGKYKLGDPLGNGAFGEIFNGTDVVTGKQLAIKRQKQSNEYEYRVLLSLRDSGVVPKAYMYFESDDNDETGEAGSNVKGASYLCMQKMSFDLSTLCKRQEIDDRLLIALALKLWGALKKIHRRGWMHRDIKPGNIMFSKDDDVVYFIDFGLAKKYIENGAHIEFVRNKSTVVGTAKYLSVWCHSQNQQSRRDDCASLMYTFVQIAKGRLPWSKVPRATCKADAKERMRRIYNMKRTTTPHDLCKGLPPAFAKIMKYVNSLEFDEKPKYSAYQKLLLQDWSRL